MPRHRSIERLKELEFLKMTELGRLLGVRYSTIKYYSELDLLPYEQKGERLAKYYQVKKAQEVLSQIKKLKKENLTMAEIVKKIKSK
jgi:DNA-binding transcriptional MerR regulator